MIRKGGDIFMKYLKKEIIDLMETVVRKLSMTSSPDKIKILSQELDSLTKAYMALEGKNVTLQKRKFT